MGRALGIYMIYKTVRAMLPTNFDLIFQLIQRRHPCGHGRSWRIERVIIGLHACPLRLSAPCPGGHWVMELAAAFKPIRTGFQILAVGDWA